VTEKRCNRQGESLQAEKKGQGILPNSYLGPCRGENWVEAVSVLQPGKKDKGARGGGDGGEIHRREDWKKHGGKKSYIEATSRQKGRLKDSPE